MGGGMGVQTVGHRTTDKGIVHCHRFASGVVVHGTDHMSAGLREKEDKQMGARRGIWGYAAADWANDVDYRKLVSRGAVFRDGSLESWYSRK